MLQRCPFTLLPSQIFNSELMKLTFHGAKDKLIKMVLLSLYLGKGLPSVHVFLRLRSCSLQLSPFSLRGPLSPSLSLPLSLPAEWGLAECVCPSQQYPLCWRRREEEREETDRGDD